MSFADDRRHIMVADVRRHLRKLRLTGDHMRVSSIHDLAAAVRGRRLDLGLSQAELAARTGVSRDWVNYFEAGKPTVELILVLRVLEALDLTLDVSAATGELASREAGSTDLDVLLDEYRRA
jgi:HTH-type transcriptional regulator/antitoxin HipB